MNQATATPARILIVEDDADASRLLESLLLAARYQLVGTVSTGREALRLAESTHPDLVIMDIVLSGDLDGIETATLLAQHQDIPVLYLTAYGDEELYARARATSPLAYLGKPYNERELQRAIELALDRHALLSQLKASQAHLAEAQAVARIGSWQWDLSEDRIEISDQLLRMLDLVPGTFEPRFDTFLQLACTADQPLIQQAVETLLRGEDAGEIDVRLACADNPEQVFRLLGHARTDSAGRIVTLVGTARDVTTEWRVTREAQAYREKLEDRVALRTAELRASNARLQVEIEERKSMAASLTSSEQRYRSLVENLPEPILVVQDEQVVFANPALTRLLGIANVRGMALDKLVHPDSYLACDACKQAALGHQSASAPTILKLQCADGSNAEVEALTFAFNYEGRPALLAVMRDLAPRRAMEHVAARFRMALDSSSDAVCLIDPDSMRFIDVNDTACISLGYSREEMLRLGPQDIKPLFNKNMLRQHFAAVFNGEPGTEIVQTVHLRKDGSTFPVEIRMRPFKSIGRPLIVAVARDISERVRADVELRETNARFQQLANNIDEAFWIRDLVENRFIYVNPAYEQLYGKSADSLYRHPRSFLACIHPEDRDRIAAAYDDQFSHPSSLNTEYRVIVNNQIRWLWVRTFPILEANGRICRTVGMAKDVTERRQSEEQYRAIIQASMDGFWVTDGQGRLLDCNAAACQISGYTREELLTLSIADLEAKETGEETAAHILRIIERGADRFETRHRCKNGQVIDIDASVYFQTTFEGGRFFTFLRDISARKQAERALIESETRFAKVFNSAPYGIAITRMDDGHIVDFNPAIMKILGYERDELIGRSTLELGLWAMPEQRDEALKVLRQDGYMHNQELLMRLHSGEVADGLLSIEPIELNGETHLLSLVVDISERKRDEERLRKSEERYRAVVEDQTEIICRLRPDGTFTFVSDTFCRFFGRTEQEIIGKTWHTIAKPEDIPDIAAELAALAPANPVVVIENRVISAHGESCWMQFVNRAFFDSDGVMTEIQSVGRDITDLKRVEEALRVSESLSRSILRAAPVGIGVLVGRVFREVNATMSKLTGYDHDELVGHSARMLYASQAEFDYVGTEKYRQIQQHTIGSVETHWQRKDGTMIDVALSSSPIVPGDLDKGVTFTAQDITASKQAEQARLSHEAIQREALVREVHHRIKNNLQGVIGLLRQHIANHPLTETAIEAAIAQINTIAVVHGLQGRMPQNELHLSDLLREVNKAVTALTMLPQQPPLDNTLSGDVWLDSSAGVSIALILNELLHNALKHGRHADGTDVAIALRGDSQQAVIRIINPGGPLPAGFDLATGEGCGTGLDLIRTLLPRRGASLKIQAIDDCIETELVLSPPLTTASKA